ncbi:hypothetical protein [Chryseobacterium indoltheticum]|uniref:hypothetical protein n=1 Tax=Chryseobacterium indoltheticum TaxID=254 RepID=UPI003F494F8D
MGETVTYTVTDWYPSTPQNQRNPANVIWELFKKRSNGRFTSTNIKKRVLELLLLAKLHKSIPIV